jgi:hypothetical protein
LQFWSNTAPYLVLFATSVLAMVLAVKRSDCRLFMLVFTAAAFGFVLYSEAVIVIGTNAYDYHPGLSGDPYLDTVLGNYFSQLSIASTSAFLIVCRLSWLWYFAAAFIYLIIDVLFASLGIFEHHWYKSVYTLIGFAPLLFLIRLWHDKLIASQWKALHYIALYFSVAAVNSTIITLPLKIAGIQRYAFGILGDISIDHSLSNIIYGVCFITVLIVIYKQKFHWALKTLFVAALVLARYSLRAFGLIYVWPGWFLTVSLADILMKYALVVLFDRALSRKPAVTRT